MGGHSTKMEESYPTGILHSSTTDFIIFYFISYNNYSLLNVENINIVTYVPFNFFFNNGGSLGEEKIP